MLWRYSGKQWIDVTEAHRNSATGLDAYLVCPGPSLADVDVDALAGAVNPPSRPGRGRWWRVDIVATKRRSMRFGRRSSRGPSSSRGGTSGSVSTEHRARMM